MTSYCSISIACVAATLFASSLAAEDRPSTQAVALRCGHLLDSRAGILLGESLIIVEGEKIRDVISGNQIPSSMTQIDLSSQTCLPGLIDSHTHLSGQTSPTEYTDQFHWNPADHVIRSTVYARRTLMAGFTTVRDLGDARNESVALRDAIAAGVIPGPRIFTAGLPIGSTGGHGDPTNGYRSDLAGNPGVLDGVINGADDAIKSVRLHYKLANDLIKIMPSGGVLDESSSGDNAQMTLEEIKAIVQTAHDYGFTVAAHAHGAASIKRAVLGGVDSIEHGSYLDDEGIRLMKAHGTWLVPTLLAGDFAARRAAEPGYYPPQVAVKAARIGPLLVGTAGRAYKAGVKIAFGTDAGVYPHGGNAAEFELMIRAGMPAMYVLQAATIRGAELLHRQEELGSLTAGKWADVIAVPGNPLEDIGLMHRVDFVMKSGSIYKRAGMPTAFESPP